jgi:hypothetical protein
MGMSAVGSRCQKTGIKTADREYLVLAVVNCRIGDSTIVNYNEELEVSNKYGYQSKPDV